MRLLRMSSMSYHSISPYGNALKEKKSFAIRLLYFLRASVSSEWLGQSSVFLEVIRLK